MWQAVREELHPKGLEIVTVALDTLGLKAAFPFIEAAKPTHPSLIDEAHLTDELFGFVNVPNGVWIDEEGVLVRPAEPAPSKRVRKPYQLPENAPQYLADTMGEANKIRTEPDKYDMALRDWVEKGSASQYALSPEEVIERSRPRPLEEAQAAAHFELAQYFHQQGQQELAVEHFRQSHRLQPDNWTYRRQAWSMVNPLQAPTDVYDSDWLTDVRKIGAENYYPPLQL